jgi:DNA-directed RNA polymerase specialized sigma24 family protein
LESPLPKKGLDMTQQEFDRLLAFLNPDQEKAANKYVIICNKMMIFFQSRGCRSPEYYADVTMNRVAKKLNDGMVIHTSNPSAFFYGVANKVLKESWDDLSQKFISLDDPFIFVDISEDPVEEAMREVERLQLEREMDCLEECLKKIPYKDRDLILRYYQGETNVKISNRKKLAEERGFPLNALRIRAFRIRDKLQSCVGRCVERSTDA